ncbi:hypothetical protein CRYUN_Cryun23aG0077700 [Craigia yunnanensis]
MGFTDSSSWAPGSPTPISNWVLCNLPKKPLIASLARISVPGTIISGYSNNRLFLDVLRLLVKCEGSLLSFNLVFAIKACVGFSFLKDGKSVHCMAVKFGLEGDPYFAPALGKMYSQLGVLEDARKVFEGFLGEILFFGASLVDMYLKCGLLDFGLKLFEEVSERDMVLWNAMISGLAKNGKGLEPGGYCLV